MSKAWLFIVSIPLLLAALLVNFVLTTDDLSKAELARNASLAGNYSKAERIYSDLIKADPKNVELHREKIRNHFNSPKKVGKSSYRDDKTITNKYASLSRSTKEFESDLGFYGLGYIEIQQGDKEKALNYYLQVNDTTFPYQNNSIGYVYLTQKQYGLAETHFLKEINSGSNQSGAFSNLAKVYQESKQKKKLDVLLSDPDISTNISNSVYRYHYYETGQYALYAQHAFKLGNFTTSGLIGALLILIAWLVFLMWIDAFETEKVRHILFALTLGCGFSMLTAPLYDFYKVTLGFELNGSYINDLLYSIFAIGIIEELVKILPFLILLRFKQIINESMDYIVYPSVCALGFAFMENLLYFHESGLDSMLSRALSATVLHMALTSFVAYGLFYADYRAKSSRFAYFFFAFFGACVIHGVYDFWLISDGWVGDFRIFSVVILIYVMQRYAVAISNALNHSEFNTGSGKTIRSAEYLAFALTMIATYQYVVLALEYGAENANLNVFSMLLSSTLLAYLLVIQLGEIRVIKGSWSSILKFKSSE
jgi:RsiW-degrading membrane proteinase PrsW (M82 family)